MKTLTSIGIQKIGQRFVDSVDHADYTLNGVPQTAEPFRRFVQGASARVYIYFDDKLIRAAVMANNLTNVNRRLMWLDEADAEKTLLLVLLGVAKNQKYITQKKLLELQGKLEEIGRIIGGLQKFFINNRK